MDPSDQWGYRDQWGESENSSSRGEGTNGEGVIGDNGTGRGTPKTNQSSTKKVLIAVAVIAVLAVLGGGGWYLGQRNSSSDEQASQQPTPTVPSNVARTTDSGDNTSSEEATRQREEQPTTSKGSCEQAKSNSGMHSPVAHFCDGQWALLGDYGTDHIDLLYWMGDAWGTYESDGYHSDGARGECYDRDKLADVKAPIELRDLMYQKTLLCHQDLPTTDEDSSTNSTSDDNWGRYGPDGDWLPWAKCDGDSYALIVDSVLVAPGEEPYDPVNESLDAHPGSISTYPGTCDAFRAKADGMTVYPIYIDYGDDLAGACAAEARGEGQVRKLQRVADYNSPC
ncbi:MAG: hypothetical protein Q4E11_06200 [Corynebacterium sp.]|uniref:hypothetical protein n=1 Tax=Corynebacterium sp. TaxID=1720 RepID=UPI0026DB4D91|nr:hypothetical protein [Corynebacterium sp.]MDO5030161.1 hypothetical protein [Corynebacterium sp.]